MNNEIDPDVPIDTDSGNTNERNQGEQCVDNYDGDQNISVQNNGEVPADIWKVVELLANEVRALYEKVKTPKVMSGPPHISNPPLVLEKTTNFRTWQGILQNEIKGIKLDCFQSENIDLNDNVMNESIGYVNAHFLLE